MIVANKNGGRRTKPVWIRCIIGLIALSFFGCQAGESETVEFKPSHSDWESQEEVLEAKSSSSQPTNPNLEAIGKAFSGF